MKKLLDLIIEKIESNELYLIFEHYKTKYVEIENKNIFDKFLLDKSKCTIEPYKSSIGPELEKDGYTITIVGTYNGSFETIRIFNTWKNKAHRGYGDTIICAGWNGTPFLNIDNNENVIILPEKELINKYKSPKSKYYHLYK